MKKFLVAAAAMIISGNAFAADMPVKAPALASAPWTGWYIGINGGGAWGNTKGQLSDIGPDGFFAVANQGAVLANGGQAINSSGGLVGGQVGYLTQWGPSTIVGVELGADWMGLKGSASNGPTPYPVTPASTFAWNLSSQSSFLATLLGRIGPNMGNWYPYVTGGLAVATLKYNATFLDTFYPSNDPISFNQTKAGWALGAGAEWRVAQHWLLRGEYLHLSFANVTGNALIFCNAPGVGNCAAGGNTTTFAYNIKYTEDIARAVLSYQW